MMRSSLLVVSQLEKEPARTLDRSATLAPWILTCGSMLLTRL
jgi:hypothetical protein